MRQVIKMKVTSEEFTKKFKEKIILKNLYYRNYEKSVFWGRINKKKFYFCWKPAYVRNDFTTIIRGTITQNDDGTYVVYKFDKFTIAKITSIILSLNLMFFAIFLLINLELVGIIFVAMSLASFLPILIKNNKRKDILLKQLLEMVGDNNL